MPAIYDRAFATGLLQTDVEQIVPVVLARAGYDKRSAEGKLVVPRNELECATKPFRRRRLHRQPDRRRRDGNRDGSRRSVWSQ